MGGRPEAIRFRYGHRGKPFLEPPLDAGGLQFNLSNSDELALVGFVIGPEIGVDIEYLKPMPDCEQISERFFSESERQVLRGIPGARKEEAFFNCWTRKEAYLKAVGEGLAAPLDSFDVTLAPGEPPRMLTLEGDPERAARWFFHHLLPAEKYIGAVAIEGGTWEVKTWSFEPGSTPELAAELPPYRRRRLLFLLFHGDRLPGQPGRQVGLLLRRGVGERLQLPARPWASPRR